MKRIIILVLILLSGCTTAEVVREVKKDMLEAELEINTFFCPSDNCEKILLDFLNSSNKSIHCAFYDLNLNNLTELLREKRNKIDVNIVVDDHNHEKLKISAKKDSSSQLMHNKFCIVDNKKIFTGSFNPTINGAYRNNNNILIISSKYLSQNYEEEFNELWNDIYGGGEEVIFPVVFSNNTRIENYFCPEDKCSERVIEKIKSAKKSIYFMTFSFTHPKIANEVVLKFYEGLDIKGIFEKRQVSKYSKFELLKFQDIDVKTDKNKYNMHHKTFIIDNETVITGSFNPTKNADYRNDENILIIHDGEIAKLFLEEFNKLW